MSDNGVLCNIDGCETESIKDGKCREHYRFKNGHNKLCKIEGCTNVSKRDGVCVKHGAELLKCKIEGCTNNSVKGGVCVKHGAELPKCKIEGCTNNSVKGGVCVKHGAELPKCKIEGCTNHSLIGGVCLTHGAKIPKCKVEGCTNHIQKDGVCFKHGAIAIRCKIEGCTNVSKRDGVCFKHGAKIPKCKVEGCTNVSKRDGVCVKHGAKIPKCKVEGCNSNAKKDGICCKHGAVVSKCKKCNFYSSVKRKVVSENKYVLLCAGCFYHLYPNETIPRRFKKKENYIHDSLVEEFGKDFFIHDKQVVGGCSTRRPDWLRDCLTHSVMIECDENQHTNTSCENKRMMTLFEDLGHRPIVLIRFNPDKYKKEDEVVRGCFKFDDKNTIHSYTNEFNIRFEKLVEVINYNIKNIPNKEVSLIHLFYNI